MFEQIKRVVLLTLFALGCRKTPPSNGSSTSVDAELIQGRWQLVSVDGGPAATGILGLVVTGDQMDEWLDEDAEQAGSNTRVVSRFKIFPRASPKRIVLVTDWYDEDGPYPSHTQKGFYELTADTLEIIWGPDNFPSDAPGSYRSTWSYTRIRG